MANQTKPLPFFFVGKEVTNERITAFAASKNSLLSQAIGKPDTKSVWYPKEHIEGLLDEMNHAAADGLRIYFGTYNDNHPNYSKQTCLLMVMTKENAESGFQMDISIEDAPDFPERSLLERGEDIFTERDFNVGSPCPPICKGGR